MNTIYDYTFTASTGETIPLSSFKGKTILIVNTATKCGLAPQFKGLEELHKKYQEKNLVVLGFPCDQFMNQEPETDASMAEACELNFGVTFPLSKKIDVNGEHTDALFKFLKKELPGGFLGLFGKSIKWNFTKFLIAPDGKPYKRYAPTVAPHKIEKDLLKLL